MIKVFPYDWRQSNKKTAADFATFVCDTRSSAPESPIIILAHSMGGLIVKLWAAHYATQPCPSGALPKVSEIAFVATPFLGAPKAVKAIVKGYNLMFDESGGLATYFFSFVERNYALYQINDAGISFPSIFELLPITSSEWCRPDLLRHAEVNMCEIADFNPDDVVPKVDYLFAKEKDDHTYDWMQLSDKDQNIISNSTVSGGDGTVPLYSAQNILVSGPNERREIDGSDHLSIVHSKELTNLIDDWYASAQKRADLETARKSANNAIRVSQNIALTGQLLPVSVDETKWSTSDESLAISLNSLALGFSGRSSSYVASAASITDSDRERVELYRVAASLETDPDLKGLWRTKASSAVSEAAGPRTPGNNEVAQEILKHQRSEFTEARTSFLNIKKKVLVIGNSQYQDPGMALHSPSNNASAFAKAAEGHLGDAEITLLKDASKEQIIDTLERILSKTSEGEMFYLYYSGHSLSPNTETHNDLDSYLLPVEATALDASKKGISLREVIALIQNSHVRLGAVFLDAGLRLPPSTGAGIPIVIMTAAQPGSASTEDVRTNLSLFTYSLISALSGGGSQSGLITAKGLSEYLENTTAVLTGGVSRPQTIFSPAAAGEIPLFAAAANDLVESADRQ
jgi:hypothetical protein